MEDSCLLSALARASGWDRLDMCLRLSDIVTTAELLHLDERTLDRMEQFVRLRAARLSADERAALLGPRHAAQPDKFRLAPATRARILNTVEALRKVAGAGGRALPLELLAAVGGATSVNVRALDTVAKGPFGPAGARTLTTVSIRALGAAASLRGDASPGRQIAADRNADRNIFQRIDLLTNCSTNPDRSSDSGSQNASPSPAATDRTSRTSPHSADTARSRKSRKRQGAALARLHKARKHRAADKENSKDAADPTSPVPAGNSVDQSAFPGAAAKPQLDPVDSEKLLEIRPLWTSTPNLITSRFINSSKHNASRSSGALHDPALLSQLI